MKRRVLPLAVVLAGLMALPAEAGLYQDVFRALDLYATPLGFPVFTTADGTRVNGARSGRLRIVPNGFGEGYRLELDRSFGVDSQGRQETYRFGGLGEMTLSGNTQWTAGYSGREFRTFESDLFVNNLNYQVRTKSGAQDATLTGTFNLGSTLEVNNFGFYTLNLNAANTNSTLELDGLLVRDEDELNFNVGPISIQGNIFYDGLVALLGSVGIDTSALEELFPASPIDRLTDAIDSQIQHIGVVLGQTEAAHDVPALMFETLMAGDGEAAQALVEQLIEAPVADSIRAEPGVQIPEPGTLLLVSIGAVTFWPRRLR